MKPTKFFLFALVLGLFSFAPSLVSAQGNPLKNIPVTIMPNQYMPVLTDAKMSITDFSVVNNKIVVGSVLTGYDKDGHLMEMPREAEVVIESATCDGLFMQLGVSPTVITNNTFMIYPVFFNVSSKNGRDSQLNNTLCSIAELNGSKASLNALVAKLKQLVRAF